MRANHSKDLGKGFARLVMNFISNEKFCKAETKNTGSFSRYVVLFFSKK